MAATNINRVVLTGNLTRDPELRSTAVGHQRLQPAAGVQHAPQGQRQRRVARQAQLLRRHRLGRAGRELRPLPGQGPRRSPSTGAWNGASGPPTAATSARPSRSSPTPSSSSAAPTATPPAAPARPPSEPTDDDAGRRRHRLLTRDHLRRPHDAVAADTRPNHDPQEP